MVIGPEYKAQGRAMQCLRAWPRMPSEGLLPLACENYP